MERLIIRFIVGGVVAMMFTIGIAIFIVTFDSWIFYHSTVVSFPGWQSHLIWLRDLLEILMTRWIFIPILLIFHVIGFLVGFRIGRDIWLCQRKYLMLTAFIFISQLLFSGPALIWLDDSKHVQKTLIYCGIFLLVPVIIKYLLVPSLKIRLLHDEKISRLKSENSNVSD